MSTQLPDFCNVDEVKARKPHVCCECHKQIDAGTKYVKTSGVWDGEFATFKQCAECHRLYQIAQRVNKETGGTEESDPWLGGLLDWLGEDYAIRGLVMAEASTREQREDGR